MKGKFPIVPVALLVVAAAVALSIYLSNRPRPAPFASEEEERTVTLPETRPPEMSDSERPEEIDLAATRRLTTGEGEETIRVMADRVRDATSVVVRVRFELSQRLQQGPIEGWVRFDSLGEDYCRVEATALQPKVKGEIRREWEVMKVHGASVSPTGMRKIEYRAHRVFDTLFEATREEMLKYTETFRNQARKVAANPLQDLLIDIPLEDRLREVIQATAVKTSGGEEIQVVSRISHPMIEAFRKSELRRVFPHLEPSFGEDVALRTDVFDPETGLLRRTLYSNIDRKDLVTQYYTEIGLGENIPMDRFELELPEPANITNINENLEGKLERGLSYDDWRKSIAEGRDPLEALRAGGLPADSTPAPGRQDSVRQEGTTDSPQ